MGEGGPAGTPRLQGLSLRRDATFQVQAPIVQAIGRIVLSRLAGEDGDEFLAEGRIRDAFEVAVENDVADELGKFLGALEDGWSGLEAGRDVFESGAAQACRGGLSVGVLPGLAVGAQVGGELRPGAERAGAVSQAGEVGSSAALGDEPAAGLEDAKEAAEETVMIGDPVEGGGAEDAVKGAFEGQAFKVSDDEGGFGGVGREMFAGGAQHILGEIDSDDTAGGQGFEQVFGETARAASGVEQGFVPLEAHASQDLPTPADLRAGDPVVGSGVPFAGHESRVNDRRRRRGGIGFPAGYYPPLFERSSQSLRTDPVPVPWVSG